MATTLINWCERIDKAGVDKAIKETKAVGDVLALVTLVFRVFADRKGEVNKDGKPARALLSRETRPFRDGLGWGDGNDWGRWNEAVREAVKGGFVSELWAGKKSFGIAPGNGTVRQSVSSLDVAKLLKGLA